MIKNLATLLDEYAEVREVLTDELLHTLVGKGFEALGGQSFIDLYDTLMEIEQQRTSRKMWKRLVESDKLWWSVYGFFIVLLLLATVIDLIALKVAAVLIAIALAICTWLKYQRGDKNA